VSGDWTDAYFGALYLDTVADLLTPALSRAEAGLIAALLRLSPGDVVLDLACGHGRHALPLAEAGAEVVGLDRSADYLRRAAASPPHPDPLPRGAREREVSGAAGRAGPRLVRGDQRALPFGAGRFDALYSWYASLFVYDDATNEACLAEAARVVRPGGRLLVQHANPLRLALEPVATAARTLPDGSRVEEESAFDATQGVDVCRRRLTRPDGTVLAGTARLRYYSPAEWRRLAERAGLRLVEVTSTSGAAHPSRSSGPEAPDLIALLETPT
jgi:SAM-dependent methyltransferase